MPTIAASLGARAARAGGRILDLVLPPQCPACSAIVEQTGTLCAGCWSALAFIEKPLCGGCGLPLACASGDDVRCPSCLRAPPPWGRARSALVYDDASRGLILGFKNGDRTEAAALFATWMARAGSELLADGALLVPVPLHWTRLFVRRYNQAALLAHAIGRSRGLAVAADLLVRRRRTRKLGKLGARARAATVADAIAVRAARAGPIRGRRIVLIDDVLTTGSTARACCAALTEAGAAGCDLLTLARALRP